MNTSTKTTLRLRPMRPEDQEFLCRLYASTREEELSIVDWPEHQKEAFLRMQFDAQHAYYQEHYAEASFQLVEIDDKPVGRLYVQRWPDEIRLVDISLLPNARGSGFGSSLLRGLMAEAEGSARPLTIHVEKFNPALRLYHRLGFRQAEDRGVYWFLKWSPSSIPHQTTESAKP